MNPTPTRFVVITAPEVADIAASNPHADLSLVPGTGWVAHLGDTVFTTVRTWPPLIGLTEVTMDDLIAESEALARDWNDQFARDDSGRFISKPYLTLVDGMLV